MSQQLPVYVAFTGSLSQCGTVEITANLTSAWTQQLFVVVVVVDFV